DLQRLDRQLEIVDRTCRRSEVQDRVERSLDVDVLRDVLMDERKAPLWKQVGDVVGVPGDDVVDAEHLVPVGEESLAQMRADESRPARDHHLGDGFYPIGSLGPHERGPHPEDGAVAYVQLWPTRPRPIE